MVQIQQIFSQQNRTALIQVEVSKINQRTSWLILCRTSDQPSIYVITLSWSSQITSNSVSKNLLPYLNKNLFRLFDPFSIMCCFNSTTYCFSYVHVQCWMMESQGNYRSPTRVAAYGYFSADEPLFLIRLMMLGPKLWFLVVFFSPLLSLLKQSMNQWYFRNLSMTSSMMNCGGATTDFLLKCQLRIQAGFIHLKSVNQWEQGRIQSMLWRWDYFYAYLKKLMYLYYQSGRMKKVVSYLLLRKGTVIILMKGTILCEGPSNSDSRQKLICLVPFFSLKVFTMQSSLILFNCDNLSLSTMGFLAKKRPVSSKVYLRDVLSSLWEREYLVLKFQSASGYIFPPGKTTADPNVIFCWIGLRLHFS